MSSTLSGGSRPSTRPSRLLVLALAAAFLAALLPASPAHAARRFEVPEESPGGPFYARLSGGLDIAPHTNEWAAIVFYRDPSCIPSDFNLLNFFDAPRAFSCPLVVEGFEIWRNGPGQDPAPMQSKLHEAAPVPVWFVRWPILQAAAADGVLTIGELESLPTLIKGFASRFNEVLHPDSREERCRCMITINASGTLSDGRTFRLHVTAMERRGRFEQRSVAIEFR